MDTNTIILGFMMTVSSGLILYTLQRLDKRIDSLDKRMDSFDTKIDSLSKDVGRLSERVARVEGILERPVYIPAAHPQMDAMLPSSQKKPSSVQS